MKFALRSIEDKHVFFNKKINNRNIKNVLVERFILSVEIPKIIENCFYNVDMFLRLIFIDWKQSDKIP